MATDVDEFTRNKACCQSQSIYATQLSDEKVFIFSHEGRWLTGYSAVVARTQEEALERLRAQWAIDGRPAEVYLDDVKVIDPQKAQVVEIWNGDY